MSSSMALRRSPKPGALTAATWSVPRSLLTTSGGQRLALDVLGDDQERAALLGHLLQDRQQVLHRADLLLVEKDLGVLEHGLHALGVGDEVGGEIAAVETACPRPPRGWCPDRLGLLDRDDAVLADLVHRLGDDVADLGRRCWPRWCRRGRSLRHRPAWRACRSTRQRLDGLLRCPA